MTSAPQRVTWKNEGQIRVFTYKEGLLSKIAHDLQIEATQFEINLNDTGVLASIQTNGLHVLGTMRNGQLDENELRLKDRRDIEHNMKDRILQGALHPVIAFNGELQRTQSTLEVSGTLSLIQRSVPISFVLRENADHWHANVELVPSRWGIKPFRALMGAIKLQDRVRIELQLPL